MFTIQKVSKTGIGAVKKLRERKLKSGLPFMINVAELASDQCYFEYPDGNIRLMAVSRSSKELDVVKELTMPEADKLRRRFHFTTIR